MYLIRQAAMLLMSQHCCLSSERQQRSCVAGGLCNSLGLVQAHLEQ